MRGIRFNMHDVTLHSDAIHRGGGQIIPAARKCLIASMMTGEAAIMEPIYLVEMQVPQSCIGTIYSCLRIKRGEVISQEQSIGELFIMRAFLPVTESFGFCNYLREQTSGQVNAQLTFDHWRIVPGNPFDKNTLAGKIEVILENVKVYQKIFLIYLNSLINFESKKLNNSLIKFLIYYGY